MKPSDKTLRYMYKEIKGMNCTEALFFGLNSFLISVPFLLFFVLVKAILK